MDFEGFDKLVHAALFGIEAVLLKLVFADDDSLAVNVSILILCAVLGGGLEIAQFYFVEGRDGDFYDLVADAFGAVVGLVGIHFSQERFV